MFMRFSGGGIGHTQNSQASTEISTPECTDSDGEDQPPGSESVIQTKGFNSDDESDSGEDEDSDYNSTTDSEGMESESDADGDPDGDYDQ
jgi:hypothetical protein